MSKPSALRSVIKTCPDTLGARLFDPHPHSQSTGCVVMAGNDFPESVTRVLQRWEVSLWVCMLIHRDLPPGVCSSMKTQCMAVGLSRFPFAVAAWLIALQGRSFLYRIPPLQPSI